MFYKLAVLCLLLFQDQKKEPGFLGVSTDTNDSGALVITNVNDGSPAQRAGLKTGDIIVQIDSTKIDDTNTLPQIIRAKGADTEVVVHILRDGKPMELKAKLGKRTGPVDPPDVFPAADFKCGTVIPWITATLDDAKKTATEKDRLILWYIYRVPGPHIQAYKSLDRYMLSGPFSDPDVSDLVSRKFVAFRKSAAGNTYGLKALDIMEPAIAVLKPDGTLIDKVDRLRSMNPDYILETLRKILEKENRLASASDDPLECLKDGDYAKAEKLADDNKLVKGLLYRRQFKLNEALEAFEGHPEEKAVTLVKAGRLEDAKKLLATLDTPRAKYHLGVCEFLTANEKKAQEVWKSIADDSIWAWQARACAEGPANCFMGEAGLTHGYADPLWPVDHKDIAKDAVRWLLRYQRSNGAWTDSRYVFGQGPVILPNVWTSVTAMASMALLEWRDLEPEAVDRALERSMPYLLDEKSMNRGKYETSYADGFRLLYLAKRNKVKEMNEIVEKLVKLQDKKGFFWHEYPNCFITGMVLYCLYKAKQAGATVPQDVVDRSVAALKAARSDKGTWPYGVKGRSADKDSAGRSPLCELALLQWGAGSKEAVQAAIELYFKNHDKLDRVRKSDYHADGELAGFFYFHSMFPVVEAAIAIEKPEYLKRVKEILAKIPEPDGSFAEDHEVGKSYATAMALLCLRRCDPR
jgi:hypothetical protein